jgi:hypothetical protein
MIISEKQIMQLITIARSLTELLNTSGDMMNQVRATQINYFLDKINNQQSEELKVIE